MGRSPSGGLGAHRPGGHARFDDAWTVGLEAWSRPTTADCNYTGGGRSQPSSLSQIYTRRRWGTNDAKSFLQETRICYESKPEYSAFGSLLPHSHDQRLRLNSGWPPGRAVDNKIDAISGQRLCSKRVCQHGGGNPVGRVATADWRRLSIHLADTLLCLCLCPDVRCW